MHVRPVTPDRLVSELADLLDALSPRRLRVAVDGAPASGTTELADSLVAPLRVRGREVVRVRTDDYLRPASLRLEHGRNDPESFYFEWFDLVGLNREVLAPLSPGGSGHVLPALWDAESDRSPRLSRVRMPESGIVIVDGPLLLGAGLPFDFAIHLWLPPDALERLTPPPQRWQLPAFTRYREEVTPERAADHLVRVDRPGHPAVIDALD
ncbi:nucleoside/nucleotide kinase family protein [Parasphingorhabdus pacifica]